MALYMHPTTYDHILSKLNAGERTEFKALVSGNEFQIVGEELIKDKNMEPTVEKQVGWILPYNKFITYEESDKEWCEYFGIGRPQMKTFMGPVYRVDPKINYELCGAKFDEPRKCESRYNFSMFNDAFNMPAKPRRTVFSPFGPISS